MENNAVKAKEVTSSKNKRFYQRLASVGRIGPHSKKKIEKIICANDRRVRQAVKVSSRSY